VLVEKFDDMRVRFKRPASARSRDSLLPPGVDPYRTRTGMSQEKLAITIVLATLIIIGAVIGAVLILAASAG
jgi:hypothetical protein